MINKLPPLTMGYSHSISNSTSGETPQSGSSSSHAWQNQSTTQGDSEDLSSGLSPLDHHSLPLAPPPPPTHTHTHKHVS